MATTFHFELHTPYRQFCEEEIQSVILPLVDGEVGIQANHAPFTSPVQAGVVRIQDANGKWRSAFIGEGFIEVKHAKTVLLTCVAERPEDIDVERARASLEDARETIEASNFEFEKSNAKKKLRRAQMRLKAAGAAA
jgi:F-type H+-transporting ATPase subunit epsilon